VKWEKSKVKTKEKKKDELRGKGKGPRKKNPGKNFGQKRGGETKKKKGWKKKARIIKVGTKAFLRGGPCTEPHGTDNWGYKKKKTACWTGGKTRRMMGGGKKRKRRDNWEKS